MSYNTRQRNAEPVLFVPDEALEAEYWQSSKATADAAAGALSDIQASAKGWQVTLAAIIALVAISTVAGGRSVISTLSSTNQWIVLGLAGFAVVVDAIALYYSTLANLGFPTLKRVSNPSKTLANDLGPLHKAAHAARNLKIATFLTGGSFVAAVLALGFFLQAPATPSNPAKVVLLNGASVCGSLQTVTPGGTPPGSSTQIIVNVKGVPVPYDLSQIKEVDPGSC